MLMETLKKLQKKKQCSIVANEYGMVALRPYSKQLTTKKYNYEIKSRNMSR